MRSNKRQTSNGYLHSVLADGAKPFLYRSGVCSLLGIPDAEGGSITHTSNPPTVGFKYENHPFLGEPFATQYPMNEPNHPTLDPTLNSEPKKELGNSHIFPRKNIPNNRLVEGRRIENPDVLNVSSDNVEERVLDDGNISMKGITPKREAIPKTKLENLSVKLAEKLEKSDNSVEKMGMEIPGISRKSQHSTGLSPLMNQALFFNDAVAPHKQHISPADNNSSLAKIEKAKADGLPSSVSFLRAPSNHNIHAQTEVPLQVKSKKMNKVTSCKTSAPSQSDIFKIEKKSNKNISNRIDQLRHVVHELAHKVSSKQTEDTNQTRHPQTEQIPPPPVKQVVIIKRSSSQARTPSAFWERSYLGRFRLRALR